MSQSPQKREFEVNTDGERLDRFLAEACPRTTRSQVQKLIQAGRVAVNGLVVEKPAFRLGKGNKVVFSLPEPEPSQLVAEDIAIEVVYEDSDVAVINKPAGLTVHPAPGHASHTLVNALLKRFPDINTVSSPLRPGIVHRLDRDTSGLMVIARNEMARQTLIKEFKSRNVVKKYLVMVRGALSPEKGAIEAPIGRNPSDRKRMAIVTRGREARTEYRVVQYLRGYSLVEARILTGRTHQIRVHFSAIGHPVVGDSTYGTKTGSPGRQFLHAFHLEFKLPSSGEFKVFTSNLPGDLLEFFLHIGGQTKLLPSSQAM